MNAALEKGAGHGIIGVGGGKQARRVPGEGGGRGITRKQNKAVCVIVKIASTESVRGDRRR